MSNSIILTGPSGVEVLDDPAHAPIPQQKGQAPAYYSGGSSQPRKEKDAMKAAAGIVEGQHIGLQGDVPNPAEQISTTEFGGTSSASGPHGPA